MISVIVPTYNREQHLRNLIPCFQNQTYSDKELLIADDSDQPSEWAQHISAQYPNIHYFYQPERQSIGEKRNRLIAHARGNVIAHFDDDDYYAPSYLEFLHRQLQEGHHDFLTLSRWFAYSVKLKTFAYWETDHIMPTHYKIEASGSSAIDMRNTSSSFIDMNLWGYGFSYIYKKHVFNQVQYDHINHGEDYNFYMQLVEHGFQVKTIPDTTGLVLHMIHTSNTSIIFPQYLLPTGLLSSLFPESAEYMARL